MNDGYTYKRYYLLNVSLDNGVSFSSALSLAVRSLASAVSEPPQFFVACENCAARLALSLLWRLDNRVSALSEARRIYICLGYFNFMRVLSLNWNYGMCNLVVQLAAIFL